MDEREYYNNLLDDKALFDEILPTSNIDDEDDDIEEEYESGIDYQNELRNYKNRFF